LIIGLLASTGLRAGEVIALTVDDVRLDSDPPQLHIRKAKFYKSRIVPIHSSTADQLRAYLQERNQVKLRRPSKAFFITGRRLPLSYSALRRMFRQLVQSVGIKNAGGKRGPLLHSFRHGFAVQRLLAWYADNLDVRAMIPHLSVYLGHLSKEETYWYLTATPELFTAAGRLFGVPASPEVIHEQRHRADRAAGAVLLYRSFGPPAPCQSTNCGKLPRYISIVDPASEPDHRQEAV
jgi:integrase